jgi:PAS domain S-box-containing protein
VPILSKNKKQFVFINIIGVLIFLCGIYYFSYSFKRFKKERKEFVLTNALTISELLPREKIFALSATPQDTVRKEYFELKNTLAKILKFNLRARFAYIYLLRDNKIYFVVDSEPVGSNDESPAGQEYTEADSSYYKVFITNSPEITKINTDRWGSWISVLIPIQNKNGDIYVFSMDYDAKIWRNMLYMEIFRTILIILLIWALYISFIYIYNKNQKLKCELVKRNKIEKELIESETKYRSITEKMTDVVWLMDTRGKSLFVTPSIKKFTGFSVEEYLSQSIDDRFTMESSILAQKYLHEGLLKYRQNPNKNFDYTERVELEYKCRDGNTKWGELIVTPYLNSQGELIGIHGVTRDITDRKITEQELIKAKEKAEESDRLKSAFLANMSHEIRTPMNGILGFASLLRKKEVKPEKQKEFLDLIEKSGERMLAIINDIIAISKIESGQMPLYLEDFDVNQLLLENYYFFKPMAEVKGLELKYPALINDSFKNIKSDKYKLNAIISNLLRNAIKFTEKGRIEFGSITGNKTMEFYVKDTGRGIPIELQTKIFERFVQGSQEYSRNYEGSGLGLAISKSYSQMLGGDITVESNFGEGSLFKVKIAAEYCSENINKSEIIKKNNFNKINMGKIKNLKIVIAEDDPISSFLLKQYIEKFAKEIEIFTNGEDVLNYCKNNNDIDCIFLDIKMPQLSGFEVIKNIREFNKNLLVFGQSAYALIDERRQAMELGCNDYITKPYTEEDIDDLIYKWFDK